MRATFVLIPGAGGDANYWHRLAPELRARGHEAIAVRLPADDDSKGLHDYADLVVEAAQDSEDVVLVGQSMGTFSAFLACDRLPVRLIVLLNPMVPRPGETAGEWWEGSGHAELLPGHEFDVQRHFLHDVPPDALTKLDPREQSGRPFADGIGAWPEVPVRMITGRDDRFFPPELQRRLARERLGIEPDEVPGGHLAALVHPEAIADRLEAYAAAMT